MFLIRCLCWREPLHSCAFICCPNFNLQGHIQLGFVHKQTTSMKEGKRDPCHKALEFTSSSPRKIETHLFNEWKICILKLTYVKLKIVLFEIRLKFDPQCTPIRLDSRFQLPFRRLPIKKYATNVEVAGIK